MKRCLVIVEQDKGLLNRPSLATLSAAKNLSEEIHLLITDKSKKEDIAKIAGIKKVLYTNQFSNNLSAENLTILLKKLSKDYDFIIAPSGTFSKNFMPRLSAVLDLQQISDVIKIHNSETFDRPIYAGNAIATVKSTDSKKLLTIRATAFPTFLVEEGKAELEVLPEIDLDKNSKHIKTEVSKNDRPDLSSARIIVSGGRGVGSSENFTVIENLADKLGAAVGASRAAVDAGYIPNDYQVGQTGKVVAPELYIAIGISGAIQHLAGMKDSKIIVAINKDEDAPIFQVADYGLVGDLFSTIPELTKLL